MTGNVVDADLLLPRNTAFPSLRSRTAFSPGKPSRNWPARSTAFSKAPIPPTCGRDDNPICELVINPNESATSCFRHLAMCAIL